MDESAFGRVVLVSGPEALVAERHVADRISMAREERPEASLTKLDAATLDAGALAEATGGSLFASDQIVVIDGIDSTPPDLVDHVVALATDTPADLALTLVHPGGIKGKALLDKLKKAKVQVLEAAAIKPWEMAGFAVNEARRAGGRLDQNTAALLVEALGHDVRALAGAIRQLLADSDTGTIDEAVARRYFAGRADVTSFSVADAVMAGRRDEALGKLRWALENGVAPVLVSSAMAAGLRNMGRYLDARDARLRDADLARAIGVPFFKLKDLSRNAAAWTPRALAEAIGTVARVDAEIKGAASDPGFSLEQMVIEVTAQHGRGGQRR